MERNRPKMGNKWISENMRRLDELSKTGRKRGNGKGELIIDQRSVITYTTRTRADTAPRQGKGRGPSHHVTSHIHTVYCVTRSCIARYIYTHYMYTNSCKDALISTCVGSKLLLLLILSTAKWMYLLFWNPSRQCQPT